MANENKQDFVDVEGTVDHTKEQKEKPILEKNAFEKFADNMYRRRVDRYEKKLEKAKNKDTVDKILGAERAAKIVKPLEKAAIIVIIGAVGGILYKKVFGQNDCSSGMEENTWYDLDTMKPTEDIPTEEIANTISEE